jgi:tyrosyl-tRNA synthetase
MKAPSTIGFFIVMTTLGVGPKIERLLFRSNGVPPKPMLLGCQAFGVTNIKTFDTTSLYSLHVTHQIKNNRFHSPNKYQRYRNALFSSMKEIDTSTIATTTTAAASGTSIAIEAATTPSTSNVLDIAATEDDNKKSLSDTTVVGVENVQSSFLQTMRDRGFIHQCTNLLELDAKLHGSAMVSAYLGFDATADSLHVGSLLQIMILRHLQKCGHRPIVLVGGGTSKVGDPTGKDESRLLLTDERIQQNINGISKVFKKFLTFTSNNEVSNTTNDAVMVNNNDWLSELKYLDFLREYGTHFTINRMLSFDSVRQRLDREAPFSFLEFNYMILQAYDFLELYRRYGTILQLGGSDQWGNMISGTELGRRCANGVQLFALTAPLITTQDGKKMGKTANGAVWLNADKLSEYDYWQFWRNTDDADVIRFLKLFTELPLQEIYQLATYQGADINQAKIILADEATALLHGRECLEVIHETINTMFSGSGGSSTEGLPRAYVTRDAIESAAGVKILDLFVELKLASSKKEARRLIQGGGARIGDDTAITDDVNPILTAANFKDGATEVTLRAGKKRAGVVEIQNEISK